MLNEGRGISNINKVETEKIFNLFKEIGFKSGIKYKILNQKFLIDFIIGNYDCYFYANKQSLILHFSAPEKYNEVKLKSLITHELNHFIEIFNIENKGYNIPNYNKIKRALIEFKPNSIPLNIFHNLIYKTLDNEINANVAQTYTYLRSFNSIDENLLKSKLENYEVRKKYKEILDIKIDKLLLDINNNHKDELIKFNNILIKNQVQIFFPFILKVENTEYYIKKWYKIFVSNTKKLFKKQDTIIKEVIEDIEYLSTYSTKSPINEEFILNYDKYINEYLDKNLKKKNNF